MSGIILISQLVSSILIPFMPHLINGLHESAQSIGNEVGTDAWKAAKAIWTKIGQKVIDRPASLDAAKELAHSPEGASSLQTPIRYQPVRAGWSILDRFTHLTTLRYYLTYKKSISLDIV